MIVSIYAAIFALMFVVLSLKTIKCRMKHQQRIGDGRSHELQQHIRAHGNFAEYVPFALLLMLLLELQNSSIYILHAIGIALLLGRLAHAYGLIAKEVYEGDRFAGSIRLRQIGMITTLNVIIAEAVLLLIKAL